MVGPSAQQLADAGLRLELTETVAQVVLDRPENRNAQTPRTWAALADIGDALPPTVRVVVLRAEGPSFSAGLDTAMLTVDGVPGSPSLVDLARLDGPALDHELAGFQRAFAWWRRPGLVSVAAVQGHAVGAGFQLALACDLRVVSDDARFCMREVQLGLVPDLGGTSTLVELVGYSRALEICATARWVDAAEAADLGIATVVVAPDQLGPTVDDLVAALTDASPAALRELTELLRAAPRRPYQQQRGAERAAQARLLPDLARRHGGA